MLGIFSLQCPLTLGFFSPTDLQWLSFLFPLITDAGHFFFQLTPGILFSPTDAKQFFPPTEHQHQIFFSSYCSRAICFSHWPLTLGIFSSYWHKGMYSPHWPLISGHENWYKAIYLPLTTKTGHCPLMKGIFPSTDAKHFVNSSPLMCNLQLFYNVLL